MNAPAEAAGRNQQQVQPCPLCSNRYRNSEPLKPTTAGDANAALRQLTYIDVTPGAGAEKRRCA
jgi:hypothetical protein